MRMRRILALTKAKLWGLVNWRKAYYMTMVESSLYLLLLGSGLSGMIGAVEVSGIEVMYTEYLFAGLIGMQTFRVFSYTLFICSNDLKWGMYRLYIQAGATPLEYSIARGINACIHMIGQLLVLLLGGMILLGTSLPVKALSMVVAAIPGVFFWAFLGVAIGTRIQDYSTRDLVSSVVVLPVVFSSSAFYDMSRAPLFLQTISQFNPLSVTVDAMRMVYVGQWSSIIPLIVIMVAASFVTLIVVNYLLPLRNLVSGQRG